MKKGNIQTLLVAFGLIAIPTDILVSSILLVIIAIIVIIYERNQKGT